MLTQSEILLDLFKIIFDGITVHVSIASGGLEHTGEHVDGSCFTSSVVAQDGEDFTFSDGEVKLVYCGEAAKFLGEFLKLDWIVVIEKLIWVFNVVKVLSLSSFFCATEAGAPLNSIIVWQDLLKINVHT